MPSPLQALMLGIFGFLVVVFGILSLFSAFRYAKDIFTPTRKSVLISGMYLTLAGLSCVIPSAAISEQLYVNSISDIFILFLCLGGPVLLITGAYVIPAYFYAMSREKTNHSK